MAVEEKQLYLRGGGGGGRGGQNQKLSHALTSLLSFRAAPHYLNALKRLAKKRKRRATHTIDREGRENAVQGLGKILPMC